MKNGFHDYEVKLQHAPIKSFQGAVMAHLGHRNSSPHSHLQTVTLNKYIQWLSSYLLKIIIQWIVKNNLLNIFMTSVLAMLNNITLDILFLLTKNIILCFDILFHNFYLAIFSIGFFTGFSNLQQFIKSNTEKKIETTIFRY